MTASAADPVPGPVVPGPVVPGPVAAGPAVLGPAVLGPAPAYLPAGRVWRSRLTPRTARGIAVVPVRLAAAAPVSAAVEDPNLRLVLALGRRLVETALGRRGGEQLDALVEPAARTGLGALRQRFGGRPTILRRAVAQTRQPSLIEAALVCLVGGGTGPRRVEAVAAELRHRNGGWRFSAVECAEPPTAAVRSSEVA